MSRLFFDRRIAGMLCPRAPPTPRWGTHDGFLFANLCGVHIVIFDFCMVPVCLFFCYPLCKPDTLVFLAGARCAKVFDLRIDRVFNICSNRLHTPPFVLAFFSISSGEWGKIPHLRVDVNSIPSLSAGPTSVIKQFTLDSGAPTHIVGTSVHYYVDLNRLVLVSGLRIWLQREQKTISWHVMN